MDEILSTQENEIQYLKKLLRDDEKTIQAERKASALYLLLAVLFGGALVLILLSLVVGSLL